MSFEGALLVGLVAFFVGLCVGVVCGVTIGEAHE